MPLQYAKSLRTKIEATRGAGGTPVRVMSFTDAVWTPEIQLISPEEYRASYFGWFQAAAGTEGNELSFGGDLDFSTAAWLGQVFVKGGVTATGGTSYTYAFTPSGTADDLSTVMAEYGWVDSMAAGTPGVRLTYLGGDKLTVKWDKGDSRVSFDATLQSGGTATDLTAFTGTPSSPTTALASVSGTQVYIDASTIGSTADNYVRSVEWSLENGFTKLYTLNGGSGPQLVARPMHRKWTLKIQRAFYNNLELAVFKTKAERKIRVLTTGPTLGSSAYKITADYYGKVAEYTRSEADGFTLEEITYEPFYDTSATTDFSWSVVCADATIT